VHAVTQQTEAIMVEAWRRLGGALTRIAIETMEPIGGYDGWKPARAVIQWSARKPLDGTADPVGVESAP
jgi:precorrin-6Y C5,15-methyltransferase (decarboxylating)